MCTELARDVDVVAAIDSKPLRTIQGVGAIAGRIHDLGDRAAGRDLEYIAVAQAGSVHIAQRIDGKAGVADVAVSAIAVAGEDFSGLCLRSQASRNTQEEKRDVLAEMHGGPLARLPGWAGK